jgi:aspartate oxidase
MGGEAYALALWAGAELIDMEFVQFFPIGHLAPRLVGMDPIMWDPFRYKLGGKLLNGQFEEFIDRYGSTDFGHYNATRDIAAYAILKEVEAGRGTRHGGAYLDFRHIPETQLRAAFGPVIDRLLVNGIDLTQMPVEVGPMAHYHMGGIRVDTNMQTRLEGLYAAGEAVGGSNGANRLSGNAITEAFVFGARAGSSAAEAAQRAPITWDETLAEKIIETLQSVRENSRSDGAAPITLQIELQKLMWEQAGPFRTGEKLTEALARIEEMSKTDLLRLRINRERDFNLARLVRITRDADDGGSGRPFRLGANREPRRTSARRFSDRGCAIAQESGAGAERRQPVDALGRSRPTQSQRIESWLIQSAKPPVFASGAGRSAKRAVTMSSTFPTKKACRCSTRCAGFAFISIARWGFATAASTLTPAKPAWRW